MIVLFLAEPAGGAVSLALQLIRKAWAVLI